MSENHLTDILGIDALVTSCNETVPDIVMVPATSSNTVTHDADYAKDNIKNLITNGTPALTNLIKIANDSQHPRAYEVVTQLLKTLSDLNKDLMDIHKTEHQLTQSDTETKGSINVKNAVFVGTTKDLREHLKSDHGD